MIPDAVLATRRRLPAIPWTVPITVHFACDDGRLFGCRLCILRYGLRAGDRRHLFGSETEALEHITDHVNASDVPGAAARQPEWPAQQAVTACLSRAGDLISQFAYLARNFRPGAILTSRVWGNEHWGTNHGRINRIVGREACKQSATGQSLAGWHAG